MLKNGREALLVAFITGIFSTLAVLLKEQKTIVSVIVFAIAVILVYLLIWKSMSKIRESVGAPSSHPVFYTIDNGLKIAFDYLPIEHEKKKKLVILYLKTKFKLIRDALAQSLEDKEIQELPTRIITAMAKTKEEMSGHAPEVFIKKMSEWDNRYNAWTTEALASIIDSRFYPDINMKYAACFDCVQVMLKSTLVAIENTIEQLNGELETYLDGRSDV